MSANIPSTMLLSELLKPTGYDCPVNLQGKTFSEATSGGGGGGDVTVEPLSVTENGTYTAPSGKAYSPVTANVPSVNGFAIEFENGDSDGFIFNKIVAFGTAQAVSQIPAGTYHAFFVTDDVRDGETHDFKDIPHLFQEYANVSATSSGYNPHYYTVIISEDVTPINSGAYGTTGRRALLVLYPSNM